MPWLAGVLGVVALVVYGLDSHEAPRRAALRQIALAQQAFHERRLAPGGVQRYGTRDELTAAGLLAEGLVGADTAPATDAPGERWWATADPSHPLTGRAFFTDQSGAVYASQMPIHPRVNRATGAPPAGLRRVSGP